MKEKAEWLRIGLHVFGVSSTSHWLSWFLVGIIYSCISGLTTPIVARISRFEMFERTPFYIFFSFFFLNALCMMTFAFLIATIVGSKSAGNTLSYSFIFSCVIFVIIFHNCVFLFMLFYQEETVEWVTWLWEIMYFYPAFNFAKGYGQIAWIAGDHFDSSSMIWSEGWDFEFSDLFSYTIGMVASGKWYIVPPIAQSFYKQS